MFYKAVDQSATKNEIRDSLLEFAAHAGEQLSQSKANNLADKFKKGAFDPLLIKFIQYTDPTGERVVHLDECTAPECDDCGRTQRGLVAA